MISILVATLVAAAPAGAPPPPRPAQADAKANAKDAKAAVSADAPIKLAAPQLSVLNMDERAGEFFNEHVSEALTAQGFSVTTAKEIQALMGMERQKVLAGCDESSACLSELANALGVEAIATGEIGRFGDRYQFLLKVNSSRDGRQLSSYSARVNGEEAILDEISKAAMVIGPEVAKKLGRTLKPKRQLQIRTPTAMRDFAWFPAGLGVLLAGGGGFFIFQANQAYGALAHPTSPMSVAAGQQLRQNGILFQGVGLLGIGLGAGALLAGGGMYLFGGGDGRPPAVEATLMPSPNGFAFAISGVVP